MNEEQQRHREFLVAVLEYQERVVDGVSEGIQRLETKISEARTELEAMEESLENAREELDRANSDADEAHEAIRAFDEELDSGGIEEGPVAGTGVGAHNATIRTEES